MPLKLMYITNRVDVALIAEAAGVDRIFVDMEYIGKSDRQGGMDTVQSHHTVEEAAAIKRALTSSQLLVRVNPIHEAGADYCDSRDEIDAVVAAGADIIMLPYFKRLDEAQRFVEYVGGRARTMLLLETPEAAEQADAFASLPGIDEIHIVLNDLKIGYGRKFLFELLADGTVDRLASIFKAHCMPFGFGGIAMPGSGMLPAELILREHYRLGSSMVILSRAFCDCAREGDIERIRERFTTGMGVLRAFEAELEERVNYFTANHAKLAECVDRIVAGMN